MSKKGERGMEGEETTVRSIREKYQLTQQKLSEITKIPKRTIENWESGKRIPPSYLPSLIEAKVQIVMLLEHIPII